MERDTMQPTEVLTADQRFFFDHAGYSHNPLTETPAAGRTRCAIKLAAAEALYLDAHKVADVHCAWEDEQEPDLSWLDEGQRVESNESAAIMLGAECLAALGNITDATDDYRRVVRAELAMECTDRLLQIIEAAKVEG